MTKTFEFFEGMEELPDAHFYEDQQAALQESVWADIEEDAEFTGASAEDCAALYSGWLRKYRGQHPRPEFRG